MAGVQAEIDALVFRMYCLKDEDRAAMTLTLAGERTDTNGADNGADNEESAEPTTTSSYGFTSDMLAYMLGRVGHSICNSRRNSTGATRSFRGFACLPSRNVAERPGTAAH